MTEFVLDGTHGSPSRTETGIPVLSAQNVRHGSLDYSTKRYTSLEEYSAFQRRLELRTGDVLLTIVGSIGRAAVVTDPLPAVLQRSVAVIRPAPELLHPSYLFHATQSQDFQRQLGRAVNQSSQAGVYLGKLRQLEIPALPLAEQRRIADVLDRVEALRAKRRAALAHLDTLTQSIFVEKFGDPLEPSNGHRITTFRAATRRITYGFTSPMKHLSAGIPIITAKNVSGGSIDFGNVHFAEELEFEALTGKSKPQPGDVLVTKDGTIGRCAIVETDRPFCINQSVALIQPAHDEVLSGFMVGYLETSRVQRVLKGMSKGNALAHLQITELAELPMPLPARSEQAEFCRRIDAVKKLQASCAAFSTRLDAVFVSIQYRAFRGEL